MNPRARATDVQAARATADQFTAVPRRVDEPSNGAAHHNPPEARANRPSYAPVMPAASVLADQLAGWRERTGPLGERLAQALAAVIERGGLDGLPLPAERALASALGVSRATVVDAYARLRERRLVVSRERAGTFVRSLGRRGRAPGTELPQLPRLLAPAAERIDLAVAAPPLDDLVADVTVRLGDAAGLVAPHGYDPLGVEALRVAIAGRLTRDGLDARPDEVLVTNGAHEALALIATLFIGRGQPVLTETPTYPGALELFERAGGRPVGVAGDAAGMRPDLLAQTLARMPAAFVYLMPGCHSPTGATTQPGRRPALLDVAARHDTLVVEDAALDKLRFDGPLPSLRALAPERVLRVGSLDKLAWAGLRVGWVCGPRATVARLARLKAARDLGSGIPGQLAALQLFDQLDALRAARVALAKRRMETLHSELARRVPAWRIERPEGGWSLWARLPLNSDVDGDRLAAAAARHGVDVTAGSAHIPGVTPADAIRVAYAASEALLVEGARRLSAAWQELTRG
jgi:DNA-binding transcriptional MocR family regulator